MQFSKAHPYTQTSVICNNLEIIQRILMVPNYLYNYRSLLREIRLTKVRTCETTDELGWVVTRKK